MDYKELAKKARLTVLRMIWKAKTSHIASCFSAVDFATVLYENLKDNDRVLWSKGWAAALIYYFLAKQGRIPEEDLLKFPHPPYLGLAETTVPGVLVNGGSVGHGLPIAVGMAIGKKRAQDGGVVYCIASDGEMNEGTTWEAAQLAAHHKLDNLVVLVDANGFQAMGRTEEIIDLNILNAFRGFGWATSFVYNGHSYANIEESLKTNLEGKPLVIKFKTIKGKGVKEMEDVLKFHYQHVDDELYERAKQEIYAA